MGTNPSSYNGANKNKEIIEHLKEIDVLQLPVDSVDWLQANEFVKRLNAEFGIDGFEFKLPTEAQWEYACRAGSTSRFSFGDKIVSEKHAWFEDRKFNIGPTEVGKFSPNSFGLYDMHGNLWEWCSDNYSEDYVVKSPQTDPTGPKKAEMAFNKKMKVVKGGSWLSSSNQCPSGFKSGANWPDTEIGFRVILVPDS